VTKALVSAFALRHRTATTIAVHLAIATVAYFAAFALRFDLSIPGSLALIALATMPLLLVCKLSGFWAGGVLSGSWRHVSIRDVEDIAHSNVLASTFFLAAMVFLRGLHGFPRSIFLLDLLLCSGLMGGVRLAIRLIQERSDRPAIRRIETLAVIVGAGSAGIRLLQEIESRARLRVGVVGFVDDDPAKLGLRVCGTRVLGTIDDLPAVIAEYEVGDVLIALPSAPGTVVRRVVQHCAGAGVRYRALPTLAELVEGKVIYTQMREVKVDDLLARDPVRLDLPHVRALIEGRTVLVTGAAGSIGSELCRQLAVYKPERLVLYDRHENGMFVLEMELRDRFPHVLLEPVLGDILLPDQLGHLFAARRPNIVFHAAAYKHVPLAEQNVVEATRNNVLGTRNVAQAAAVHGVQDFVLVSTDKAVRPTSVMGVTKRVAELVVQGLPRRGCRFAAVRFGNVLGSNGSVVPLFREQIARGGPVTVTHPEVTRYFMTIPEAVQLILQAATLGRGGETFVLEMGEPVRIADLARHMIRLSGFEPDEDIAITFTGLRPGEKLYEELVADDEEVVTTPHDRIKVLRPNGAQPEPERWLPRLAGCVEAGDAAAIVQMLQDLVPGYQPSPPLITAPRARAAAHEAEVLVAGAAAPLARGRLRRLPSLAPSQPSRTDLPAVAPAGALSPQRPT
jgi:FlaA1/EpsC-like NDP-sugar epimerase